MVAKYLMDFEGLIDLLGEELKNPLPGMEGQIKMAPKPVNNTRFNFNHLNEVKLGGVLILLYPKDGSVYFPLTERNQYPGIHSGQISLPGGKKERQDSSLTDTSIRETTEEIGVLGVNVNVLGNLSELYIQASNFKVLPTVGYTANRPEFINDKREVANLLEVDLKELLNPGIRFSKQMKVKNDLELHIPYFDIQNQMVWGATAMILSEFVTILNRIN
ncbi:CoA pyrophosphatase [Reichenbachiella sp. MALMAid0571]|uniref:NUDIX hydrolase n=1 Tax=Reichenbachiella sp. MALMAid0571 TaxID=3143939 RepID=UPI0032DFAF59